MKIDMHVHTKYSSDSLNSLKNIYKKCIKKSIIPIITDHNTIKGAEEFVKKYNYGFIGEEITTSQGEVIGLFLNHEIKPFQEISKTISLIKKQNGLVYIPHPFDRLRKHQISPEALDSISIDILEVFNSRNLYTSSNAKAMDYANKKKIAKGAGSDAHMVMEIGNSFIDIGDFNSPEEFMANLIKAEMSYKKSPLIVHLLTKIVKLKNKVLQSKRIIKWNQTKKHE